MSEDQQYQLLQEQTQIKDYLKTVPYEVLLEQRRKAQSAERKLKKRIKPEPIQQEQQDNEAPAFKRGRYTPVERSAKQKVSRFKMIFEPTHRKGVDPRYQNYAGALDPDLAQKSYTFIETLQQKEKQVLKKSLSSKKITPDQKEVLVKRYNQVTDAIKSNQSRNIEREVVQENKRQVSEGIKSGTKVFYKTKKIIKSEVQQRKLSKLSDNKLSKVIKEKKEKLDSRMMFKQRHYSRTVEKANQPRSG